MSLVAPDLLFPADPASRAIAADLYAGVKDLPIVSPHGHTDPRWYAENENFPDPAQLLLQFGPLGGKLPQSRPHVTEVGLLKELRRP